MKSYPVNRQGRPHNTFGLRQFITDAPAKGFPVEGFPVAAQIFAIARKGMKVKVVVAPGRKNGPILFKQV